MGLRAVIGFVCILIVCFLLFVLYIYSNKGYRGMLAYFMPVRTDKNVLKEESMSKYEKTKLLLFIVFGVLFLTLMYFNGLNGRYVNVIDTKLYIDTRTGDVFSLQSRKKLN